MILARNEPNDKIKELFAFYMHAGHAATEDIYICDRIGHVICGVREATDQACSGK